MKTAVVIIHGIGEQKPMDTLRGFVEAVIGVRKDRRNYYSKPDKLSETFELRRLQGVGRNGAHFYEYYWAYSVEETSLRAVLVWLTSLAFRSARDVPAHAKSLWLLSRLIGFALLGLAFSGVIGHAKQWFDAQLPFGFVWCAVLAIVILVQFFLVYFLGDAARYLSPRPINIRLRQKIRAEGVRLLRTLHARDEYERIVVVGHSLGSVIGYDIITRLWQEYSESIPGMTDPVTQEAIRTCMKTGVPVQPVIRRELSEIGGQLGPDVDHQVLVNFRAAQVRGNREQRRLGNPWRITDFITLGSPLAHSMLFLANGADDFIMRKVQRELPTCPPQRDEKNGYAYAAQAPFNVGENKKFTPFLLHDAAPFAVTRWTNLYFPARFGLLGDFVGGPVAPALGYGIEDIPVRSGHWNGLADHTILSHLLYWSTSSDEPYDENPPNEVKLSLVQLRKTLNLTDRGTFKPLPWTTSTAPTRSRSMRQR